MIKLNKCCSINTLVQIKEVYHSNVNEFILHECTKCSKFWLYRKLETDWMENIRMNEDAYEAWYIGVLTEDLDKVYALEFDKIFWTHGYLHLSTMDARECIDWRRIKE